MLPASRCKVSTQFCVLPRSLVATKAQSSEKQAHVKPNQRATEYKKGLRGRNSPMCTLSQNGYGDKPARLPCPPLNFHGASPTAVAHGSPPRLFPTAVPRGFPPLLFPTDSLRACPAQPLAPTVLPHGRAQKKDKTKRQQKACSRTPPARATKRGQKARLLTSHARGRVASRAAHRARVRFAHRAKRRAPRAHQQRDQTRARSPHGSLPTPPPPTFRQESMNLQSLNEKK